MREIIVFMPGEVEDALHDNVADGLRRLADAIDAGQIDARLIDCQGHGFQKDNQRAHLMLRVDLAAPIIQRFERRPVSRELGGGSADADIQGK